jgi:ABC-type multidrug transport system ATPase subunit
MTIKQIEQELEKKAAHWLAAGNKEHEAGDMQARNFSFGMVSGLEMAMALLKNRRKKSPQQ